MKLLLTVLLLAPCVLSQRGLNGGLDAASSRIFHGEAASDHPFMVHLEVGPEDKMRQCGGSIYSENAILTSAQCVAPKGKRMPVSNIRILVGVHDWTDVDEEKRQEVKARRIVTHPDYRGTAENDIAIILLEEDLEFNDKVRAVHSIAEEDWIDGYEGNAWVFGWGGTEVEREGVRVLQMIEYSISDQTDCDDYWSGKGRMLSEGMFCTGSPEEEQSAWVGDEGSPVFIKDGSNNMVQAGVVSFGTEKGSSRDYDVNTDVSSFTDWIEKTVDEGDQYPYISLAGGLDNGVVMLTKDASSKPATICNHGAGQKELNAICRTLGYGRAVNRGSRDYVGRRPQKGYEKMPYFCATSLQCDEGTDDFTNDCTFTEYPDNAAVPCFNGDELAVQCTTGEEWEFEYTHMLTKEGPRGRAKCKLLAQKYGVQIDVKHTLSAMLVNVKESGVEIVDNDMRYRRSETTHVSRYRDIEHSCLACVAMINGVESDFNTYRIEDESICKMGHDAAESKLNDWLDNYKPEDDDSDGY